MKNLTVSVLLLLMSVFFAGCASTYKASSAAPAKVEEAVTGSKSDLYAAAKRVLFEEGYSIRYSNEETGVLVTAGKQMKFNKSIADCGTNAGLPANWINNIVVRVSLTLNISENNVAAAADIKADDIRANENYKADISCVSLGSIEKQIIQKMRG